MKFQRTLKQEISTDTIFAVIFSKIKKRDFFSKGESMKNISHYNVDWEKAKVLVWDLLQEHQDVLGENLRDIKNIVLKIALSITLLLPVLR